MEARTGSAEGYRFGFQGQETDDEVYGSENAASFKYRVHDARIGRFLSIDPLAPDYPHNSPYAFSENKVIRFIELEGAEVDDPFEDLDPFTRVIARAMLSLNQRGRQINEQIGVEPTLENNLNTATIEMGIFITPFADAQMLISTARGRANSGVVAKGYTLETVKITAQRPPLWRRIRNWASAAGLFGRRNHLTKFEGGASYLVPKPALDKYGRTMVGRPDGQFIIPSSEMDDLLRAADGDISKIEDALGIPQGSWQGQELIRIDIPKPSNHNLRMTTGAESGANDLFIEGGFTPGGQSEAIIDPIPEGSYIETWIKIE